jgi:hypothetical protein
MGKRCAKEALVERLAMCKKLAHEFSDGITAKHIQELAEEIEQQLRAIER